MVLQDAALSQRRLGTACFREFAGNMYSIELGEEKYSIHDCLFTILAPLPELFDHNTTYPFY